MRDGMAKGLAFSLPHSLVKGSGGGGAPPTTLMLTGALPDADEGDDYNVFLNISGGTSPYGSPIVLSGALPTGFALTIIGNQLKVSGVTVGLDGSYSGVLQVSDSSGPPQNATDMFSFKINPVDLLITESGDFITTEDGKYIRVES